MCQDSLPYLHLVVYDQIFLPIAHVQNMEYMIYVKVVFTLILSISIFVYLSLSILQLKPSSIQPHLSCQNPVLRKEWSATTDADRSSYINAVLCLATKPSRIGLVNSTLYDDFAYVHNLLEPDGEFY
jgi:hypothetical protein